MWGGESGIGGGLDARGRMKGGGGSAGLGSCALQLLRLTEKDRREGRGTCLL